MTDLIPGMDCTIKELRNQHIERVLERCNQRQGEAARILGVSRETVTRWVSAERDRKLREIIAKSKL